MLEATVSGSFHRHMPAIYAAVCELRELGVKVLSPSDPRIVDHIGEFLFVASDKLRSIKLVEDRHLECIRKSNFLWVVCPDGYTGPSTSGEILAAAVLGKPVYSDAPALDITIGQYVRRVPNFCTAINDVMDRARRKPAAAGSGHVLLEPASAIDRSIDALDQLRPLLLGQGKNSSTVAEVGLMRTRQTLIQTFG
jgi:hypothetical protein